MVVGRELKDEVDVPKPPKNMLQEFGMSDMMDFRHMPKKNFNKFSIKELEKLAKKMKPYRNQSGYKNIYSQIQTTLKKMRKGNLFFYYICFFRTPNFLVTIKKMGVKMQKL